MFKPVDSKQSFPKLEEAILELWKEYSVFQKQVDQGQKDYIFYDGPPFATGLPHYGHLLAGTIKDVIPRYFAMKGYRIERRWGWDCHGLPVENEVEKELKLGSKTDIEEFGIDKFNEACRAIVLRYAGEWKKTVERMGRFVDMENDYKTMNPEFMESIWWVFKSLWDKKLIYEGHKIVPYCPRCATPLSNFETNQGYQDKQDPALTVKFELVSTPGTYLLAWTTTPWTLPSNLALAVGAELTYAEIEDKSGEKYILALERLPHYYKNPEDYKLIREFLGKELEGKKYKPLMAYFSNKPEKNAFTVATGNFVSTQDGTGIVHMAPFGEDDMSVLHELKIEPVYPLDAEGRFNDLVPEFQGEVVFDANPLIIKKLKDENKVIRHETIDHSYPFCWRCDTPLIYRPISTWFVKVEALKPTLLNSNEKIHWVPDHIKEGRFGKWLEGARDWAISRNRYWGTPLPIWRCDCGKTKVLGSIQELQKASGQTITDLHKHFVDPITLPCDTCKDPLDITVVRHGETDYNRTQRWAGSTDVELNETGLAQAKAAAEALTGETFDLIISSPLKRARKTAEIINEALNLPLIFEDDLREQHYGEWEGAYAKDIMEQTGKTIEELRGSLAPKGESFDRVKERVHKVMQKYLGKKVLMVAHGHVYFAVYALCHQKTLKELVTLEHKNATPYKLTYQNKLVRVPEVLDCWFESGSMPYAQLHYPFENKEKFEANFPARFIAEGLDQTRGWFYTLHVLSNALFKKPAFENCVVNGIVLAEDGRKMSKRLKNYPNPNHILNEYGADALRFYLMNSAVVKADDLRFSEKGVQDVVRNVLLPIWNSYSFFVTYANIDAWKPGNKEASKNKLDQWILSRLNKLIVQVTRELEAYDLQKSSMEIYEFVDDLTNWYIRRSRRRFWKSDDDSDKQSAYATLYEVLTTLCRIIAPFMPFISDAIYQNLAGDTSVHLATYPTADPKKINEALEQEIGFTKRVVSLGLAVRAKKKLKVRLPLAMARITLGANTQLGTDQIETIQEELNVKMVEFIQDPSELATIIARPDAKKLGPKYGKDVQKIIQEAKEGHFEKLPNGHIKVLDFELLPDELTIDYLGKEGFDVESEAGVLVALDTHITPELEQEGLARDLIRQIQELRKEAGYNVEDRITLAIVNLPDDLKNNFGQMIQQETLANSLENDITQPDQFTEFENMVIKIKK